MISAVGFAFGDSEDYQYNQEKSHDDDHFDELACVFIALEGIQRPIYVHQMYYEVWNDCKAEQGINILPHSHHNWRVSFSPTTRNDLMLIHL